MTGWLIAGGVFLALSVLAVMWALAILSRNPSDNDPCDGANWGGEDRFHGGCF